MTSKQITEWMAFYRTEPFGVDRIEYLLGMFMSLFASANRSKGKKAPKAEKFMPFLFKPKEDWQELDSWLNRQREYVNNGGVFREEIKDDGDDEYWRN